MDVNKLWQKATSRFTCGHADCTYCHEIYNCNECPSDWNINDYEVMNFIKRVTELLNQQFDTDEVFFSDEEFVEILKSSANSI